MFGNPEWFRERKVGWGLAPITWQGWAYTASWASVLCLPFLALMLRHQVLESLIWLAATSGVLVWDVRDVLKAKRPAPPPVEEAGEEPFYIGDEPDPDSVATRRFNLQLRR